MRTVILILAVWVVLIVLVSFPEESHAVVFVLSHGRIRAIDRQKKKKVSRREKRLKAIMNRRAKRKKKHQRRSQKLRELRKWLRRIKQKRKWLRKMMRKQSGVEKNKKP